MKTIKLMLHHRKFTQLPARLFGNIKYKTVSCINANIIKLENSGLVIGSKHNLQETKKDRTL
ncbi:MAG: hypothetical protein HFH00_11695 [Dorea sp.]|nr:hypothetical protein [Dorea sp.]